MKSGRDILMLKQNTNRRWWTQKCTSHGFGMGRYAIQPSAFLFWFDEDILKVTGDRKALDLVFGTIFQTLGTSDARLEYQQESLNGSNV